MCCLTRLKSELLKIKALSSSSLSAAEHAESFVCSVVLGDDIVGRLGLRSVFELKIKIFQILQTCDIGKVSQM